MEKRKTKALFVAVVAMILCTVAMVAATYALFSDKETVTNHLQAGTLNVELERLSYKKTYIGSDGTMVTDEKDESETPYVFTKGTTENVFGLKSGDLIAPTSEAEAKLRITNNGTVACAYSVKLKVNGDKNALSKQLKVYLNGEEKGYLATLENDGELFVIENAELKANGRSREFTVKIEFEDLENEENNSAKGQTAEFDLIIEAIQKT